LIQRRKQEHLLPEGVLVTYEEGNWSGPRDRAMWCQAVVGRQGWPSASVVRASKKWMPCLAAVAR
jgi:hypothetical protein